MQAFATSTLYGYDNPAGKMELLREEAVFNAYTDKWLLPRHNLYTPAEIGLHTVQVLRYLSDLTQQERLEKEQELLEEKLREQICLLCKEQDSLCTFCVEENNAAAAAYIKHHMKLAEVDKRLAAVQKLVQDTLPGVRARREGATAAPAAPIVPSAAGGAGAGGAGAGAGIDHLLLPLLPHQYTVPAWPLLPPGSEPFTEEDSIEALIDEILAR